MFVYMKSFKYPHIKTLIFHKKCKIVQFSKTAAISLRLLSYYRSVASKNKDFSKQKRFIIQIIKTSCSFKLN